ncbi:hypothetical protein AMTR_s00013p00151660 [Amborella trichopoda]|uniref:Uncharacterized protein n=1 Tax=Amborella trichopoda TaxID=13333 RepID=W1PQ19_AMBTC|nr:hypothetical protein AMTR_s00013p00151660 [Amborella trichopoda]
MVIHVKFASVLESAKKWVPIGRFPKWIKGFSSHALPQLDRHYHDFSVFHVDSSNASLHEVSNLVSPLSQPGGTSTDLEESNIAAMDFDLGMDFKVPIGVFFNEMKHIKARMTVESGAVIALNNEGRTEAHGIIKSIAKPKVPLGKEP